MGRRRGPHVVVVGAGLAGIGAVKTLREGGITNVTLLEAADRPGGRVRSLMLKDGYVELGAQFLHGKNEVYDLAEQNGMLADVDSDDEGLPDTVLQYRPFAFQTSGGASVNPVTVTHNLRILEGLLGEVGEDTSDVNVSKGDFFRRRNKSLKEEMIGPDHIKEAMIRWMDDWECQDSAGKPDQLSAVGDNQYKLCEGNGTMHTKKGMEEVFKRLLEVSVPKGCLHVNKEVKRIHWTNGERGFMRTNKCCSDGDGDGDADVVSDAETDPAEGTKGEEKPNLFCFNNNLINGENLEQETTRLIKEELSTNIFTAREERRTSSVVGDSNKREHTADAKIRFEEDTEILPDFNVIVECKDGDVYFADHVIVTSSIGVLKNSPDLFQPPLSSQHVKAINATGFGNVAKMFVLWEPEKSSFLQTYCPCVNDAVTEWQRRILGRDAKGVVPLWLEETPTELKSARYTKKMSDGRYWYQDVCLYNFIKSQAFCILAWVAGEAAVVMESLPLSEVKDVLHELLTMFLGSPNLPRPCRVIRTEWHSNPYTRGAYSYLATGVPLENQEVLSQPLPSSKRPVVQLAGEACSKHYFSTVHGALVSGQDAAHVILAHHYLKQA